MKQIPKFYLNNNCLKLIYQEKTTTSSGGKCLLMFTFKNKTNFFVIEKNFNGGKT